MKNDFYYEDTAQSSSAIEKELPVESGNQISETEKRLKPMLEAFPFFSCLSLAFGFMFTFCLYKNPCGLTYPLFTIFACFCGVTACRKLHVTIKKDSWFLLVVAVLIGISTCRTADPFLLFLNSAALMLLGCIFALHQFYQDGTWNIGKYLSSIVLYLCCAIGTIAVPFRHLKQYIKTRDNKAIRQIPVLFLGFLASLPVLSILVFILGEADMIFSDLITHFFFYILRPVTFLKLAGQTLLGTLALYCLICVCCLHRIPQGNSDRRKGNPLMVIAGLAMITLIYFLFCVIQIVYLFLGNGNLPISYTYSSYARQGFFQLLLVAFFNLVLVLCCLKYIRPNQAVRILLTLIGICTYIMIASACYRMILYVREYHLSYLRFLVLWFLVMLAVLMAGVIRIIWRETFPLFRYSLGVVAVFYVVLSWARPDSIVAWDYVNHLDIETVSLTDFHYLSLLSADAAPAIAALTEKMYEKTSDMDFVSWNSADLKSYYSFHVWPEYYNLNWRNYNFSFAKARKLFP